MSLIFNVLLKWMVPGPVRPYNLIDVAVQLMKDSSGCLGT